MVSNLIDNAAQHTAAGSSRSTPGYGLGLPLVAAIARLHGIALSLLDNDPGLRVELHFAGELS